MEQLALDLSAEPPPPGADTPLEASLPAAPDADRPSLSSLLGPLETGLDRLFRFMEIGESEIDKAKGRHPERADAIHDAFRYLSPTDVIDTEMLYQAHAREIVERVAGGSDLRPGTAAEVLGALSKLTLVAPPTRVQTLLYMKLFGELFPADAETILAEIGGMDPDSYEESQIGELEDEFCRKLSTERDCRTR